MHLNSLHHVTCPHGSILGVSHLAQGRNTHSVPVLSATQALGFLSCFLWVTDVLNCKQLHSVAWAIRRCAHIYASHLPGKRQISARGPEKKAKWLFPVCRKMPVGLEVACWKGNFPTLRGQGRAKAMGSKGCVLCTVLSTCLSALQIFPMCPQLQIVGKH